MINVLITGVGGPVGQAIVKAARMSSLPLRLIGTDRHALSVGLHWVDEHYVLPDCREPERYISEMIRVCSAERVAAVLPGSEGELELLSAHPRRLRVEAGALAIVSPPQALRVGLDKLETCRFLERSGLRFPRYASSTDADGVRKLVAEFGFPLFAKPRHGSGSKGVMTLKSWEDAHFLESLGGEFVLQEYLLPDDEEYTVGAFTAKNGEQVGCIVFKRELAAGNTYRAWVAHNAQIEKEAETVVKAFGAVGPCNVQLRLTRAGPVSFEINPRFSGTTAMRAHFGYNEVAMALKSFVRNEALDRPKIKDGVAMRFWEEHYLDAA